MLNKSFHWICSICNKIIVTSLLDLFEALFTTNVVFDLNWKNAVIFNFEFNPTNNLKERFCTMESLLRFFIDLYQNAHPVIVTCTNCNMNVFVCRATNVWPFNEICCSKCNMLFKCRSHVLLPKKRVRKLICALKKCCEMAKTKHLC